MRKLLYSLILILAFSSCERKSGRKYADNVNKVNQYSNRKSDRKTSKAKITKSPDTYNLLSGTEIFKKYNSAVFMIYTSSGEDVFQGSGFFISPDGLAVSNYHLFKGADLGAIRLSNGEVYDINNIIAGSDDDDYVVFKIASNGKIFNYIPISNKKSNVGDKVYAIGSPRGWENTFSSGEISQLRKNNRIQINAPIDHGSSGGVLLNTYGEAIGITTSGVDESSANLNFAMDIDVIRKHL